MPFDVLLLLLLLLRNQLYARSGRWSVIMQCIMHATAMYFRLLEISSETLIVILDTHHPDTQYLRQLGFEVPRSYFEAKRYPRV